MEEKTIEIDSAITDAITKSVMEGLQPQIDALKPVETDKEVNKTASTNEAVEAEIVGKFDKMSKEAFAIGQINAVLSGNTKELSEMNAHALKTLKSAGYIEKATYLNAGTTADGGAFVPNADLLRDIFTVLPNYSSVANLAREITLLEGDSLDVATLTADVIMTEVGTEGGNKAVTKPTIGDGNIAVREFAGIALMTKKLLRQSAIDVYGVVRDSFARAIAKKREELLLTDSTSGIVTKSGVTVMTAATGVVSVNNLTVSSIKSMPFQVPTASANGGTYVFSRALVGALSVKEDSTGQPILTLNQGVQGGSMSGTFNGYPFVVAETLGTSDAVSTVHAVFGNWKEYAVVVKQGAVDSQVFDSGVVVDGGSVEHNLIQQNKIALRVENWENVGYPVPSAFVRLRTAAS